MGVVSLGFRTDLMVRGLSGSVIVARERYVLVRTPANPSFWWGNFLLFRAPPGPGDAAQWRADFAAEFPGAHHLAFGVDGTRGDYGDPAELAALGVTAQVSTVLTAGHLTAPPASTTEALYRPLTSDDDWAQAAGLRLACTDGGQDPDHQQFVERSIRDERDVCDRGHGAWFGAFVDDRLRSGCGVLTDGSGVLRFQSVHDNPIQARRRFARRRVESARITWRRQTMSLPGPYGGALVGRTVRSAISAEKIGICAGQPVHTAHAV